jgi:hypothetical protein
MLRNLIAMALVMVCALNLKAQDTCNVVFDLFESDTACVGGAGVYLPTVLPIGGTYSGDGVTPWGFFDVTGLAAGVYEVTYTADTAVCIGSGSAFITLVESTPFTLNGNFEVCGPDSALMTSLEGYILTWDDASKEAAHTFFVDSTYESTVTFTNEAGCVSSQNFVIYLNDFSRVEVIAPEQICYGEEITIEIANANLVQWIPYEIYENSITGVFTQDSVLTAKVISSICDSIYHITIEVAAAIEYDIITDTIICNGQLGHAIFIGSDLGCRLVGFGDFTDSISFSLSDDLVLEFIANGEFNCYADTLISYIVDDYPNLSVTAPDSLCEGATFDVYASGALDYLWIDNVVGDTLMLGTQQDMQLIAEQSLDWSIIGYSIYGCGVSEHVVVYVDPTPEVRIDSLTAFCYDKPIALQASGAFQYTWSNGFVGDVLEFEGIIDTTFSVMGATSIGCINYDTLSMTMHEVPVVSAIGENVICEGDTATVRGLGALRYVWEGILEGDTVQLTPIADSTVNFVGYNVYGCSDFSNFNIHVNPAPFIAFSGTDFICAGDSSSLSVSSDGSIQWLGGSTAWVIPIEPLEDTTYVVTSIGDNGCPRTSSFAVSVFPYPVLDVLGENVACYGDSLYLIATGADNYSWSNGLTGGDVSFVPAGSTTLLLFGSSSEGCTTVYPFPIDIHPRASVAFAFSADTLCESGSGVSWIASPQGGTLSGDGIVNNWFDLGSANQGLNTVTYTYVNEFNCESVAADQIVVESCLGLASLDEEGLHVFPNPMSDVLTIQFDGHAGSYRLLNNQGAVVITGLWNGRNQIDVQQLASGVYILEVQGASTNSRKRIVKL